MDFARDLCHNPGHHQLAAGPCPAHNLRLDADGLKTAPAGQARRYTIENYEFQK
jgi:hypothetical protein